MWDFTEAVEAAFAEHRADEAKRLVMSTRDLESPERISLAQEVARRLSMAEADLLSRLAGVAPLGYVPVPGSLRLEQDLDADDNTIRFRYTIDVRKMPR